MIGPPPEALRLPTVLQQHSSVSGSGESGGGKYTVPSTPVMDVGLAKV